MRKKQAEDGENGMQTVKVFNVAMIYDEAGAGAPPLLLVHGFPLNREMWAPQLEGLAGLTRLVAPDLPGFGDTPMWAGEMWMNILAEALNEFMNRIDARPAVLCGMSMGGYLALAYYRIHADHLAGLILASTRAAPDTPEAAQNREKTAQLAREEGARPVVENMLPKLLAPATYRQNSELVDQVRASMLKTSPAGIAAASLAMKARADSRPTLPLIELPTLVIHGAEDQIVPVKEAEAMAHSIPTARFERIPDAGHLANLEQPEAWNAAVRRFYEQSFGVQLRGQL